jgi:hypothetical protein
MSLLVHGVVRADDVQHAGPVKSGDTRIVPFEGLGAVVSDATSPELADDDAVAHLDVLVALAAEGPVLPLPFGTVAPDDAAVREQVLEPVADDLRSRLAEFEDVVELRVHLQFEADAGVQELVLADPEIQQLAAASRRPGAGVAERMELGEAVAQRVSQIRTERAQEWTAPLADLAERVARLPAPEEGYRVALLVRRDRVAEVDAAVGELRRRAEAQADVEYVGPMPPYAFLDMAVPQGAEASAPAADERGSSRWGW